MINIEVNNMLHFKAEVLVSESGFTHLLISYIQLINQKKLY